MTEAGKAAEQSSWYTSMRTSPFTRLAIKQIRSEFLQRCNILPAQVENLPMKVSTIQTQTARARTIPLVARASA
eukprot:1833548-Pleurochrysis_carterae.AAC.1